jgi:hypothetical protein
LKPDGGNYWQPCHGKKPEAIVRYSIFISNQITQGPVAQQMPLRYHTDHVGITERKQGGNVMMIRNNTTFAMPGALDDIYANVITI